MNMKKTLVAAVLCGSFVGAHAAVVNVSTIWDVNQTNAFTTLSGGPVSIANGDHVILNVDFLGTQALTFGTGSYTLRTWLYAGDNNSGFTINNASLDLLGFVGTGGAASSYSIATQSNGVAHLGPHWSGSLLAGQSVTFDGLKVEFDVQTIAVSPHQYGNGWFIRDTGTVGVSQAAPIPEPETYAMMLAGLGMLGFMARRRKQQIAT